MKGSVATFGREKWKKGDTLVLKLKDLKGNKEGLEVGFLPAENQMNGWGYNDYGLPIKKEMKVTEDKVEFTIPFDREYGIYIQDKSSRRSFFHYYFIKKKQWLWRKKKD